MDKGMRWMQWALAGLLAVVLAACGGGGGGTTSPNTETLSGVAATGAGVQGIVSLRDLATGQIQATHTDNGSYAFNVTGLGGPFVLRAESDDHATVLYSLVVKAGSRTQANINPLTQRMAARLVSISSGGLTDPAIAFDAPGAMGGITFLSLAQAADWVLDNTSPYFRARLAAHGVDAASLDPVTTPFTVGQGLDLAFDEVRFFYDAATGEAWEQSVATGQVVGTQLFALGNENGLLLEVSAPSSYLVPGSSQTLSAILTSSSYRQLTIGKGLRWEVSDPALASVDANGLVTAASFTGSHSLTVTAHYQSGDLHLQDAVVLTLSEQPLVASVDMSGLPDTFQSPGDYPLFTTLHLVNGGTTEGYTGTWTVVDPDPYTQAAVSIGTINGLPTLMVNKPVQDLSVHLRAVQTFGGVEYTTDKTVMVKQFVLTPLNLYLQCPYSIDYQVAAGCSGSVLNNDGSYSDVTADLQLQVAAADTTYVTASGSTLTSVWDNRNTSHYVQVTGRYGGLSSQVAVYVNPRKTLMTGLEIVGLSALDEGASTTLQAWATWDDGSRTNISYSVSWTSSDTAAAAFSSYGYGALTARYILDQASDKTVTVTLAACKYMGWNVGGCTADNRISITTDITVRYAPPSLAGVNIDTGELASGFLTVSANHALQARAVWNKKLPDGSAYMTPIAAGVTWTSSNADAAVSGDTLAVAASPVERLAMISASYQDPADSGVTRTGRKVVTLYAPLAVPKYLDMTANYYVSTYLLGGDGLVRELVNNYDSASGSYVYRPTAPRPFIAQVRQAVATGSYNPPVYLLADGTVWYPELVSTTSFSAEMRQQLILQLGNTYGSAMVPRRIPGLDNVTALVSTNWWGSPGQLHALRADGTVWAISVSQNYQTGVSSYTLTQQFSGAVKMASHGYALFVLDTAGQVWSRGSTAAYIGRDGATSTFGKVVKADQTTLTGIVDIAASGDAAMALDQQGNLWGWGSNYNGVLGLGDAVNRLYATPVTSVTGFTRLSPTAQAGLRADGSLWAWGPSHQGSLEPQKVGNFTGLLQVMGAYLVGADHRVSYWSSYQYNSPPLTVKPVLDETGSSGTQLLLQ
ncbi:MAG: putative lipoprotein [Moraxellaceae bacterium]|jgi:hypothetical protein|nr:putative lipoprotein [Moraxellaceae bacterium]